MSGDYDDEYEEVTSMKGDYDEGEYEEDMGYLESYMSVVLAELPRAGPDPRLAACLAAAGALACTALAARRLRRTTDLLADLSLEHARGAALQVCCVALLLGAGSGPLAVATYQLFSFVSLITPFWTLSTSLLVFSNLFMFKNRDIYAMRAVARFASVFSLAVHVCEELFGFALAVLKRMLDARDPFGATLAAIRLTSMLLVMSVPVAVLGVSAARARLSRGVLLLLLHVVVLLGADVLFAAYKLTDYRAPRDPPYMFMLFAVKPILEILWFALLRAWMRRYLTKEDLYLP